MAYWHAAKEIVHPIYKYRFRSLLEARHAVFIEALGFRYEYETYQASDGSKRYWIDFYLPDVAQYYEVKPDRNALIKEKGLYWFNKFIEYEDWLFAAWDRVRELDENNPELCQQISELFPEYTEHSIMLIKSRIVLDMVEEKGIKSFSLPPARQDTRWDVVSALTNAMFTELRQDFTIDDFTIAFGPPTPINRLLPGQFNGFCLRKEEGKWDVRPWCYLCGNRQWVGGGGIDNFYCWDVDDLKSASEVDKDMKAHNRACGLANGARFDHGENTFVFLEDWRQQHGNDPWAYWGIEDAA